MEFSMKFKRIISVVLLLCIAFSMAACKKGVDPKKVVNDFMGSLLKYDVVKMSQYVVDVPTSGDNFVYDVYTDPHYVSLYQAAYAEKLSYKVTSVTGDTVKVKVTMPDLVSLYNNAFAALASAATSNEDFMNDINDPENEIHLTIIALMINEINNGSVDTYTEEVALKVNTINDETKIVSNEQLERLMTSKLCTKFVAE